DQATLAAAVVQPAAPQRRKAKTRSLRSQASIVKIGIDRIIVGMIEHIQERCIEPNLHAFGDVGVLGNLEVALVGASVPEDVATGTAPRRIMHGIRIGAVHQKVSRARGDSCGTVSLVIAIEAYQGAWTHIAARGSVITAEVRSIHGDA